MFRLRGWMSAFGREHRECDRGESGWISRKTVDQRAEGLASIALECTPLYEPAPLTETVRQQLTSDAQPLPCLLFSRLNRCHELMPRAGGFLNFSVDAFEFLLSRLAKSDGFRNEHVHLFEIGSGGHYSRPP
jgi:hypothetical protein